MPKKQVRGPAAGIVNLWRRRAIVFSQVSSFLQEHEVVHPHDECSALGRVTFDKQALVRGRGQISHELEFSSKCFEKEAAALRDARNSFEKSARWEIRSSAKKKLPTFYPIFR